MREMADGGSRMDSHVSYFSCMYLRKKRREKKQRAGRPTKEEEDLILRYKSERKCSHTSIDFKRSIDSIVVEDILVKKMKLIQKEKKTQAVHKKVFTNGIFQRSDDFA